MARFRWKARDRAGADVEGLERATSEFELGANLRSRGLLVLSIDTEQGSAARGPRDFGLLPVRSIDVERSLRQLSLLVRSGLSLLQALRIVADTATRDALRNVYEDLALRIERGEPLSEALRSKPRYLPPLVCELVSAGEATGTLDLALRRSAEFLERRRVLRSSVLQALYYPTLVLTLTTGVAAFLVIEVIPTLETLLRGSREGLPAVTRALLEVSHFVHTWALQLGMGLVFALALFVVAYRTPAGRRGIDRALLATPALGGLSRIVSTSYFTRTLGICLSSGLHLLKALPLSQAVVSNSIAADGVGTALVRVTRGEPLAESLEGCPAFSRLVPSMVAVGEASGELDRVLHELAEHHEAELAAWIRRASQLIEPVITLAIGAIVGFVYIAFFLAMFAAAGGVR